MTITIYIDDREQHIPYFPLLEAEGYDIVENYRLEVGDYLITNGTHSMRIELKYDMDLFSSKVSGHLNAQLVELSAFPNSLLIFVGDMMDDDYLEEFAKYDIYKSFIYNYPKGIKNLRNSLVGRTVANGYRVGFLECDDDSDLEQALMYYCKKLEKEEFELDNTAGELQRIMKDKHVSMADKNKARKVALVMAFDGVGKKFAKKLLEAFEYDLPRLLMATDKEILGIKGVGKAKLAAIRQLGFQPIYQAIDEVKEAFDKVMSVKN